MSTIDTEVIEEYLDNAQMHGAAANGWAEGFWMGRAVQHAHQNSVDYDWLTEEIEQRGLDPAVVALPKPGDSDPSLN